LVGRSSGDIDIMIVRENTEGEYSSVGGRMFEGSEREVVLQETIMTRHGVERVLRNAFELAKSRPRRKLTSATKSNGVAIAMPYWDERVAAMAAQYPNIALDREHIDALVAKLVLDPGRFDVIVASNLFGDILSDHAPACAGALGVAPSANLNPERRHPPMFEPVHGSAPDIAGQGIANPVGMIWAGAMMLDHLGEPEAANAVLGALERTLADPNGRTRDLGAGLTTHQCGKAVADHL
jgi:tartrate dehydrogenase/decarboxylase / D-malate dehydrogenase